MRFSAGNSVRQRLSDDPRGRCDTWGRIESIDSESSPPILKVILLANVERTVCFNSETLMRDDGEAWLIEEDAIDRHIQNGINRMSDSELEQALKRAGME